MNSFLVIIPKYAVTEPVEVLLFTNELRFDKTSTERAEVSTTAQA